MIVLMQERFSFPLSRANLKLVQFPAPTAIQLPQGYQVSQLIKS